MEGGEDNLGYIYDSVSSSSGGGTSRPLPKLPVVRIAELPKEGQNQKVPCVLICKELLSYCDSYIRCLL